MCNCIGTECSYNKIKIETEATCTYLSVYLHVYVITDLEEVYIIKIHILCPMNIIWCVIYYVKKTIKTAPFDSYNNCTF